MLQAQHPRAQLHQQTKLPVALRTVFQVSSMRLYGRRGAQVQVFLRCENGDAQTAGENNRRHDLVQVQKAGLERFFGALQLLSEKAAQNDEN